MDPDLRLALAEKTGESFGRADAMPVIAERRKASGRKSAAMANGVFTRTVDQDRGSYSPVPKSLRIHRGSGQYRRWTYLPEAISSAVGMRVLTLAPVAAISVFETPKIARQRLGCPSNGS